MLEIVQQNQLKKTLEKAILNGETAGASMLLLQDGVEVFYHQDGHANRETGKLIQRDTIYRLYSMTKPVTAAAAMILVERGELDLHEPVSKYLDGFCGQMVDEAGKLVPVVRDMTVKELLSMTSGLVYGGCHRAGMETEQLFLEVVDKLHGDAPMSTMEIANRLGKCPLLFQPGTSWEYGTSADVLGAVIEAASGMRLGAFLQKELFEPLGMKDTGFWVPAEKQARLAVTYAADGVDAVTPYTGDNLGISNSMNREPAFESGGAGLASTIDDYARFAQMLMNGGEWKGTRILRPGTVRYLTSVTLSDRQQQRFLDWHTLSGHSYGNLMRVMTDSTKAGDLGCTGEYGWDGWLGAYFANFPQQGLTLLMMMQKKDAGTTSLTRKLRNIILSAWI